MRAAAILLLLVATPIVGIVRACTVPRGRWESRRYRGEYPHHNGPFA